MEGCACQERVGVAQGGQHEGDLVLQAVDFDPRVLPLAWDEDVCQRGPPLDIQGNVGPLDDAEDLEAIADGAVVQARVDGEQVRQIARYGRDDGRQVGALRLWRGSLVFLEDISDDTALGARREREGGVRFAGEARGVGEG